MAPYDFLLYMATALFLFTSIPTLYADIKNKNSNIYNLPERMCVITGCVLGIVYGISIGNMAVVISYSPSVCIETVVLGVKTYYAYKNGYAVGPVEPVAPAAPVAPVAPVAPAARTAPTTPAPSVHL